MSNELKKREEVTDYDYAAAVEMFGTAGWQAYVADAKVVRQALLESSPYGASTNDQWQYARGQLAVFDQIIHHENFVRRMIEAQESAGEE